MFASDRNLKRMADAGVTSVILPGTTFFLGKNQYAPYQKLKEAGVEIALATDFNPGSCHIQSMPFIITLAVMKLQMTVEEAFLAATLHGAKALGLQDEIGSIAIGKKADLIIWDISNLSDIPYYVSDHPIRYVIKNGKLVFGS